MYLKNYLWRLCETVGSKGVNMIVSIILARLLLPSEFGEVAIISVILGGSITSSSDAAL